MIRHVCFETDSRRSEESKYLTPARQHMQRLLPMKNQHITANRWCVASDQRQNQATTAESLIRIWF